MGLLWFEGPQELPMILILKQTLPWFLKSSPTSYLRNVKVHGRNFYCRSVWAVRAHHVVMWSGRRGRREREQERARENEREREIE